MSVKRFFRFLPKFCTIDKKENNNDTNWTIRQISSKARVQYPAILTTFQQNNGRSPRITGTDPKNKFVEN